MEVFMRNLPQDLTDETLQTQLAILIKELGIEYWSCQKQRRTRYGSITFLYVQDGERFLHEYGEQQLASSSAFGKPRSKARLQILGGKVYCNQSRSDPDRFVIRTLVSQAEDRGEVKKQNQLTEQESIEFETLHLSCGCFVYLDNNDFTYHPEIEWLAPGVANFLRHMLIMDFFIDKTPTKLQIPYRIIDTLYYSTDTTTLTLTLWEPPRFFKDQNQNLEHSMSEFSIQNNQAPTITRLAELPHDTKSHKEILSQAFVYRIFVSDTNIFEKIKSLKERELLNIAYYNFPPNRASRMDSLAMEMGALKSLIARSIHRVSFDVLFQVEALARNGYLLPNTVRQLLFRIVDHVNRHQVIPFSGSAVKLLFAQIPFPSPYHAAEVFDAHELWKCIEQNEMDIRRGRNSGVVSTKSQTHKRVMIVFSVDVTPTKMILRGPDFEVGNRVLRRFSSFSEYFLRVHFCEEDGTDLRSISAISNEEIYQRYKDVFRNGINICGRVYGFLGFSHSSLRSHSAWFMASFVFEKTLQTYFTVINRLGKFDDFYSPARCAARIGQAFSETPHAVPLKFNGIEVKRMMDVKSKDGTRVFSDGVGLISPGAIAAIHATMNSRQAASTCFQIRWAGAKGMLALDKRLRGNAIFMRDSMIKYPSSDGENLEICELANKPIPLVLNRQLIKILEDMGLSDTWLFQQQDKALRHLQNVTANATSTALFLKKQQMGEVVGFHNLIRRLNAIDIDFKGDRFLRSVVEAAVLQELRLLKHKARIPVQEGVTLFGIMDETGYLEDGAIYVTFDDAPFTDTSASDLDGATMIVTRAPSLHPGDIQLARNSIPPPGHPLRSLRNCIVFSRQGHRDLPSCLSGGDLDGDIYGVIWDSDAVSQIKQVFEPADYARAAPKDIGRPVERWDMAEFFVEFMATDQLGRIAIKHMIIADQRDSGTVHEDCRILAEMHSTGVDYSKTGIPINMGLLRGMKTNRYRPDFLAPAPLSKILDREEISFDDDESSLLHDEEHVDSGPKHLYYRSEKVLGKLYRAIDEKTIWRNDIKITGNPDVNVFQRFCDYVTSECDRHFGGVSWPNTMTKRAWEIRNAYENGIHNATIDYSDHAARAITELEVFTGTILNKSGSQTRRQRDNSIRLKDEFDRILRWTQTMIRRPDANGKQDEEDLEDEEGGVALYASADGLRRSIACLHVACVKRAAQRYVGRSGGARGLQSFRIVAACCVIKELDAAIQRGAI